MSYYSKGSVNCDYTGGMQQQYVHNTEALPHCLILNDVTILYCYIYIPSLILDFNDANMRSTKTLGENEICTLKCSKFVHNSTHHREDTHSNPSFCSPCSSHRFLNQDGIQVEDSDNRSRGLMNVKALQSITEMPVAL